MTATPGAPDDLDALRARLRGLGYLDARVDRFVLGGVSRGTLTAITVQAAWRLGALAGLLLGPTAVIGLVARAPGLVTGVSDALILAVYLAVPFGLAAAALTATAILAGHTLARRSVHQPAFAARARRATVATGLFTTATCLGYLTLWWRAAVPVDDVLSALPALAIAAAIALVLGHGVTVGILASLARTGVTDLPAGSPMWSWRALAPIGLTAVGSAWLLLRSLAPAAGAAPPPPPLTVVPTGMRLVVLAVDGVDPAVIDRLAGEGQVPTLARWLSGVRAPLSTDPARDPARSWTTIATGQPPERHGIGALEGRQLPGVGGRVDADRMSLLTTATDLLRLTRPTIATGDERRLPTFWEVAARAGLRTAAVHWWTTWPADETHGIVLSDRAILRLEQGGALAGEIAPASLYAALQKTTGARASRVATAVSRAVTGVGVNHREPVARSAHLDATIMALAAEAALGDLDLLTLYLPGLDILQHALFPPDGGGLDPGAAAERVAAVEAYYVWLDQIIGDTLPAEGPGLLTVLVTQPGRVRSTAAGLVALGTSAAPGPALPAESVAPTVLHLLGVPVAEDLATSVAESLLPAGFLRSHPVRTVATYGDRHRGTRAVGGRPLDAEMIERMRSLGYVR